MTPLERVATKLAALHPAWRETPWASIGAETRELFLEDARDVLRVIREPSDHMLSDGAFQIFRGERITDDDIEAAKRVWRGMTKAALSEGETR